MIRILFTIPNFDTAGSGRALLNIAKGLNPEEFDVHIACKTDEGDFFKTLVKSGIPVHVFNYEAPMRPLRLLFNESWKISKKLKEIKPDIIHSFHYNNNYGEAVAARLAGAKWIFTKKNMNWGSDGANAWKIRSQLANKIVIQNQTMKEQFYPKSQKTVLIERGIHMERFAPAQPNPEIRKLMNTPVPARVMICVANMQPVKGLEYLIDAFLQIANKHPDWHLWLVGNDASTYGLELHKKVTRSKMDDRIHFSGKQLDVVAFLQHAEVFVLPTKATGEGSPVALLEAMANAKVVFGAAVPGITDQLNHVPNHLFQPENSAAIAEKLKLVLENSPEVNTMLGNSFRKYVLSKYTIEREVEEHAKLYVSLVKKADA